MVEFFCPIPIAHTHDIIICAATCLRRDDVLGSIDQRPPCCTRPTEYIPLGGAREAQHEAVFGSRNGWVCTGSTNGSSSYLGNKQDGCKICKTLYQLNSFNSRHSRTFHNWFPVFILIVFLRKDQCLKFLELVFLNTLPETSSSHMKISFFLVNTIKMVDFPWLNVSLQECRCFFCR